MNTRGISVLVACVLALGVAGCSSSAKSSDGSDAKDTPAEGSKDAKDQVKITSCKVDEIGYYTITGTALNNTSKASDFFIELAITDKSGATQLGITVATADNVAPDQTAKWEAPSTVKEEAGAVCKVVDVSRTASL